MEKIKLLGILLVLLVVFMTCKNNDVIIEDESKTSFESIKVIYQEECICCSNLLTLTGETISTPDSCGSPYNRAFAINLDAFNIAENYDTGDTLTIEYELTSECSVGCDCPIVCDSRDGIPLQLISVD